MELNKIYNMDCIEWMKLIPDWSIDCIITDPPYWTTACKWDTIIPFDLMWEQLKRIIKPNGAIVLFGSEPFSSALRMSNIKQYKYDWIWIKNSSWWFATAKKMPLKFHEIISVFYKELPIYNPQWWEYAESTKKRFKDWEKVNRSKQLLNSTNSIQNWLSFEWEQWIEINRWTYPKSYIQIWNDGNNKRIHPTQKPVLLLEYLIKTYTNEWETILDFTMWSWTTAIACINTNRNYIWFELDEWYRNIANKRIQDRLSDNSLFS